MITARRIVDEFTSDIRSAIECYNVEQIKYLCKSCYNFLETLVCSDFTDTRIANITRFLESKFDTDEKIKLVLLLNTKKVSLNSKELAKEFRDRLNDDHTKTIMLVKETSKLIDFFDWLKEDDGRFFMRSAIVQDDGGEEEIHELCSSGATPTLDRNDVRKFLEPILLNDTYIDEGISTLYFNLPSNYDDVISFFISLIKLQPKNIEEALAYTVKVTF